MEGRYLLRGHSIMWFKNLCRNWPRMFRAGVVLFFVLTLVMLFVNWRERFTYEGLRRHLKDATSNFHGTQRKDFLGATSRLPGTTGSVTADSAPQASVQDNPTQLSGSGITLSKNESKIRFNSTEVKKMRQHILNSYYNVDHLTFVRSSLRIGQRLRYEMPLSHEKLFEVTEDFLKLLPEESPLKGRHFNTCAVVGNSAVVLNSSCGQDIDSMDFVIRCNLPQIEGYEKDVGSKANLTTMNPSVIAHNFGQWENETKDDYDRLLRRLTQVGDQILYVPALRSSGVEKYVRVIIQTVLRHNLPIKTAFPPAPINTLVEAIGKKLGLRSANRPRELTCTPWLPPSATRSTCTASIRSARTHEAGR
ncbi:CMP-N-acetylneuraminate-poly-alpha-2,8-sialyltransferase-like [Branchiostoma floridae]|uniref:CMP-N-acetylneuraminate-poly-alpha-2, 8-sialyltransferase-like n=2 Tax=Branchiostoma floridae TaxID=7739 RepID=A0A9J7N6I6_BRAFL|nr:CMP-N-acetylneuraminate-poly-alpha-2,8-sialyltransferase-like [Branchiostoma floridae]